MYLLVSQSVLRGAYLRTSGSQIEQNARRAVRSKLNLLERNARGAFNYWSLHGGRFALRIYTAGYFFEIGGAPQCGHIPIQLILAPRGGNARAKETPRNKILGSRIKYLPLSC